MSENYTNNPITYSLLYNMYQNQHFDCFVANCIMFSRIIVLLCSTQDAWMWLNSTLQVQPQLAHFKSINGILANKFFRESNTKKNERIK